MVSQAEIDRMRRQAEEECARCQGREHGDCDPACRYWRAMATRPELEERKRPAKVPRKLKAQEWSGPVYPGAGRENVT